MLANAPFFSSFSSTAAFSTTVSSNPLAALSRTTSPTLSTAPSITPASPALTFRAPPALTFRAPPALTSRVSSSELPATPSASRAHTSRATRLQLLRHRRFVLQSLGQLFRPRARFAAYPAARHVTRAIPARYEPALVLQCIHQRYTGE